MTMRPQRRIRQLFAKSRVAVDQKVDDRILRDTLMASLPDRLEPHKWVGRIDHGWAFAEGQIVRSRVTKLATAAVIIAAVALGLHLGRSAGGRGVALGEVLRQIRNSSYTLDMTIKDRGRSSGPVEVMIFEPGMLRWDSPETLGGMSLIMDLTTNDLLLLYHEQQIAAKEMPDADIDDMSEEPNPLAMFVGPIKNLWNLRDRTEKFLGEKEIDGQPVVGFEVQQNDRDFSRDIIVWAHRKTGNPILVELTLYHPEDRSKFTTITMSNFNLEAELDERLFSLEPPEGYTLAYQKELEDTITAAESTPEAQKIQHGMQLWKSGEQEKSIETMRSIDWTQPFEFSNETYLFSMTQKGFMQLKREDQQKVFAELSDTSLQFRDICRKLRDIARAAVSEKNYDEAESCLETILELGRLISGKHDSLPIAQIAGLMLQRYSLEEMASLYSQTNDTGKLRQVQDEAGRVEAAIKSLKGTGG
jgi:outer membrane lipoprotein-sorting protein